MKDDAELECYALMIAHLELPQQNGVVAQTLEAQIKSAWKRQKDADEGCTWAIDRLLDGKKITPLEVWQKVRYAAQNNRFRLARDLTQSLDTSAVPLLKAAWAQPVRFLKDHLAAPQKINQELLVLALLRLATQDPQQTKELLLSKWTPYLSSEERHWIWGYLGMQLAYTHDPEALSYFERVSNPRDLSDEMLGWYVRTLLRSDQINWSQIEKLIDFMSNEQKKDSTWNYWQAKAQLALSPREAKSREKPLALLRSIASTKGFYELLALDELGQGAILSAPAAPPSSETVERVHKHAGLNRAIYAIKLGLRSAGVREWNYSTSLVNFQGQSGRMSDEELMAAAQWAAQEGLWDRGIFASEKALGFSDPNLLYPMPYKDSVLKASEKYGVPPAFVYGLIRQESRFVMDIHSAVGASGLMQVMPKTAKWTAKKIGISPFSLDMLHDKDINTAIGTGYMHLVLDAFDGSKALAAAAYNAGPSRARRWREGPDVEGAIWVENIPFNETRDYVKKVLANTTLYDSLLSQQPQFIHNHLGVIGPHNPPSSGSTDPQTADLP
jgi:soluble lytic murein transglycosylase